MNTKGLYRSAAHISSGGTPLLPGKIKRKRDDKMIEKMEVKIEQIRMENKKSTMEV